MSQDNKNLTNEAIEATQKDEYTEKDLFLENETTCCLCGHDLHFKHEIDFTEHKITEFAACSQCHVELRTRQSTLH